MPSRPESLVFLPRPLRERAGVKGRIIVEPVTKVRGRYDLQTLVSKMPKTYKPEEQDWGPPVGKEAW